LKETHYTAVNRRNDWSHQRLFSYRRHCNIVLEYFGNLFLVF